MATAKNNKKGKKINDTAKKPAKTSTKAKKNVILCRNLKNKR